MKHTIRVINHPDTGGFKEVAMNDNKASGAELIKSRLIPLLKTSPKQYGYTDAGTGRLFNIREQEDGRFFLEEAIPNGRCVEQTDQGKVIKAWDEPRILEIERSGANGFRDGIAKTDIDPATLVFVGDGYGIDSIYHDTLNDCAGVIDDAIKRNVRYQGRRTISDREKLKQARQEAAGQRAYWQGVVAMFNTHEQASTGLFCGCHDGLGHPLTPETKHAILAYLNAPDQNGWLSIRDKLITSSTTLWQAWLLLDAAAPRSGVRGHPRTAALRKAIRHAVTTKRQEAIDTLAALPSESGLTVV